MGAHAPATLRLMSARRPLLARTMLAYLYVRSSSDVVDPETTHGRMCGGATGNTYTATCGNIINTHGECEGQLHTHCDHQVLRACPQAEIHQLIVRDATQDAVRLQHQPKR